MNVFVNDEAIVCPPALSVSALLAQLQLPTAGMALALNQHILPHAQWRDHILQEGDSLLLFQVIAGG
ncbi:MULTISPECIES: sulfur carrier protein ThiS [Edwardsiella]|uniref:Sulfur carrier protein ThiS n=2 Tax=Edwardsiella anguillarum TaxID=1821960 RepID=A0A076LRA6_9GAMM|nr:MULTISPECIES: sulfur carrier protein ThiS [Edwardsiella]AKM48543.1 thiamine biosynthesis protein ThiS [Edwardsiella sp. EA181011]GAJ67807.1 thiamine biosynthesis protein ThiS [Edwardsiella piscicida]AIJ09217.1 Sulfur carrier protein ThiS [Edwardsiella anguillarum ET080813]AKR77130.1 sulfur carrier protein ThiS [Edwardsiella sp. LADL05-105]KAB0590020.1 sulfur carrier protein ThiS [Edwardsiella anguillarum]